MAYQFNIYPTGVPESYIPKVNTPLGVTAIMDRGMGITEHSLSGVAFYIQAIENYINQYNVGSSGTHIISGYFDNVGYFKIQQGIIQDKYRTSSDGIISGVSHIYTQALTTLAGVSDITIRLLSTVSGLFYNTIIDDSAFIDPQRSYFTTLQIQSDGCIQNLYSGYLAVYGKDERPLPLSGQIVDVGDLTTHDYYISDSICGLGNIAQTTYLKSYGQYDDYTYGIIGGCLKGKNLSLSNSSILTSGNLYVDGGVLLDVGALTTQKSIAEDIINFDHHDHDGINSRQITASGLNSGETTTTPFTIILASGNLECDQTFKGNLIGLSTNWEEVKTGKLIGSPQKLYTFGDELFVANFTEVVADRTGETFRAPNNARIVTCCSIPTSDGKMGDDFGVFYFKTSEYPGEAGTSWLYVGFPVVLYIYLWNQKKTISLTLSTPQVMGGYINTYIAIYNAFYRLNYKVYMHILGHFQGTYAGVACIDLTKNTFEVVAAEANGGAYSYEIVPIAYRTSLMYCTYNGYTGDTTGSEACYKNYSPLYDWHEINRAYLDLGPQYNTSIEGFDTYGYATFEESMPSPEQEYTRHRFGGIYTSTNDRTFFLRENTTIHEIGQSSITYFPFSKTAMSGCGSLIACHDYLYTGEALHIRYALNGEQSIDDRYRVKLEEITGLSDPWTINPVIVNGYMYAITSTDMTYTYWKSLLMGQPDEKVGIRGSKIIRRRIAEVG